MNTASILSAFSSRRVASHIANAKHRVIYAAPGIQVEAAVALAEKAVALGPHSLTVSLDFDEHTLRMGYGSLQAFETLRKVGIEPTQSPGFRSGILIVDERGWVFTPTALYLEQEPQSDETPNAVELSPAQVKTLAIRLSPAAQKEAIEAAESPAEAQAIAKLTIELGVNAVAPTHLATVKAAIKIAPPVKFDVVRQVRVFEPYLQYVDIKLTGAAIQKHKVAIPKSLQQLGASQELRDRLRTTFDLIEKGSELSSKGIDDKVGALRNIFTPSLGERLGRVMLKNARPLFDQRLEELKAELVAFQAKVKKDLQAKLNESRDLVVDYFLPIALAKPPDSLVARVNPVNEETVKRWLQRELEKAFPTAEKLVQEMRLDAQFKDVTWETLSDPDFDNALRKAFKDVDWDKPFHDYKAAGESGTSQPSASF